MWRNSLELSTRPSSYFPEKIENSTVNQLTLHLQRPLRSRVKHQQWRFIYHYRHKLYPLIPSRLVQDLSLKGRHSLLAFA